MGEIEFLDRPAIGDQENRIFIRGHRQALQIARFRPVGARNRLAVVGADDQQLIRLVNL